MKKLALSTLLLLSIVVLTCREEESLNIGNVQFAFHTSALNGPGGRVLTDLPNGSVLFVSIVRSNGDEVFTLKELTLLKFGDRYISNPLPLPLGNYKITDFLITNADHEVLYVTPKEGSPLANLIEHPLPIAFNVIENNVTDLLVEVVSVNAHQPGEFGYASFEIVVIPSEVFQLSVFVPTEEGTPELHGALAYILLGTDTVYKKYLEPGVNSIVFNTLTDESYTLVLIEPSYKKYSRTFSLGQLTDELQGLPLVVILEPAFTFTAMANRGDFEQARILELRIDLNPSIPGAVSIDWGDGIIEENGTTQHTYQSAGPYFVSVYGNLEAIEAFEVYYCCNDISDISLRYLPELRRLSMALCKTPTTIDLSYNKKLESLEFSESSILSLDVSNNIYLKNFDIAFNPNFSVESINKIIHDLLQHAQEHNITGGHFVFLSGPHPSDAALVELRTLRDDYNWSVMPEDF